MSVTMRRVGDNALRLCLAAVVLIVLSFAAAARAEPPVLVLEEAVSDARLRGHLSFLDDPSAGLTVADALGAEGWTPRPPDAVERNYTRGAIWYRVTVLRAPGAASEWVLAVGEPFIDDVRVALVDDGTVTERLLGRRIPNADLPVASRLHVATLDLPEGRPVTLLVRLASRDEIQFEAALWRPTALLFVEVRQSTMRAMFFTGLVFIVLIYVLFGVSLRDPTMLAYAVYVATFALFASSHSGLLAVVFPSYGGSTAGLVTGIGVLGNIAAIIFMWDRVLDLARTYPAFHRAYVATGAATVLLFLAIPGEWYILIVRPTFIATLVITVASLGLAVALVRQGRADRLLRLYIVAFVPFLAFSAAHAAEVFLPSEIDIHAVRKGGELAMLVHIVLLSVALALRVSRVQRERIQDGAELVATRSAINDHRNFVSMLSHQIRNPLAIITAALDLMELKDRWSTDAAKIRRAALRIRDLTSDLLADSRLEEMSAAMTVQPVDLAALVARLVEERRETAPQPIRLDGRIEGVTVMGDPTLLSVLVSNLLDNAVKYGGDAEIRVAVQDGAVVTVADGGAGIPAGETDKVFEKYYRSSLTSTQPGTGLGLYLVRQIAERHGGSVALRSVPGQGAEFTVRLPAEVPVAAQ